MLSFVQKCSRLCLVAVAKFCSHYKESIHELLQEHEFARPKTWSEKCDRCRVRQDGRISESRKNLEFGVFPCKDLLTTFWPWVIWYSRRMSSTLFILLQVMLGNFLIRDICSSLPESLVELLAISPSLLTEWRPWRPWRRWRQWRQWRQWKPWRAWSRCRWRGDASNEGHEGNEGNEGDEGDEVICSLMMAMLASFGSFDAPKWHSRTNTGRSSFRSVGPELSCTAPREWTQGSCHARQQKDFGWVSLKVRAFLFEVPLVEDDSRLWWWKYLPATPVPCRFAMMAGLQCTQGQWQRQGWWTRSWLKEASLWWSAAWEGVVAGWDVDAVRQHLQCN